MKKYNETFTAIICVDVVANLLLDSLVPTFVQGMNEIEATAYNAAYNKATRITETIIDGLLPNSVAMSHLLLNLQGWAKVEDRVVGVLVYNPDVLTHGEPVEQTAYAYIQTDDRGRIIDIGSADGDKVYWKTGMCNTLASCRAGIDNISPCTEERYCEILNANYFIKHDSEGTPKYHGTDRDTKSTVNWYENGSDNTLFYCEDASRNGGKVNKVTFTAYVQGIRHYLSIKDLH